MSPLSKVYNEIYNDIISAKKPDMPFIIGINGIDTSGKSQFAKKLKGYLEEKGQRVQIIHIDDFHNPREIRYSGDNEVENYFFRSFNIKKLVDYLLRPIKKNKFLQEKLTLLNLQTDKYDIVKNYSVDKDTLVILEGVFIFREEIEPYLDYKVFIEIPIELCKERALQRDVPLYGEDILKKYDTKYIPTQKYYLEKFPPRKYADIIIENSDWNNPRVIFKSNS